jgi:hypothetical protein
MNHHCLFKELFPEKRLIPKHHFMLHYAYVIRQTGPLISLWTMRFEGKHNYFSQLANHTKNFRNICYSLAMRHQQFSAHIFRNNELIDSLKTDLLFPIKLSEFSESFDIVEYFRSNHNLVDCSIETEMYTTKQIWYRNYNYKCSFIVCYEMGCVFLKFGQITEFIILDESICVLVLKELNVEYFDNHLFAYKVKIHEDSFKLVNVRNLAIHDCMELQQNIIFDGFYVVTRHYL